MIRHRSPEQAGKFFDYLSVLAYTEVRSTYLKQNLGLIAASVASINTSVAGVKLESMYFEGAELKGSKLTEATFIRCTFIDVVINDCEWIDCQFISCQINGLTYNVATRLDGLKFDENCHVLGLLKDEDDSSMFRTYVPEQCQAILESLGAHFPIKQQTRSIQIRPIRNDVRGCLEAFLRIFSRTTGAAEHLIDLKLGTRSPLFRNSVLPVLIDYGVVRKTPYRGRGQQFRFELAYPVEQILKAENPEASLPSNLVGFWEKLRD